MIERFNFYDVYGYLLPGLVLIAIIWLPFGIIQHTWPTAELASAIIALALAYVAGHLVQTVATNAIPSEVADPTGRRRFPHDLFLDKENQRFSTSFKEKLAQRVQAAFGLELAVDRQADEEISRTRQDAFLECRSFLIRKEAATYAEQFEGLYAMMRGLGVVFALGSLYLGGWAASIKKYDCLRVSAVVVLWLSVAILLATAVIRMMRGSRDPNRARMDRITLGAWAMGALAVGYLCGWDRVNEVRAVMTLVGVALLCVFAALRFFVSYRFFAEKFADTVWRDFAATVSTAVADGNA